MAEAAVATRRSPALRVVKRIADAVALILVAPLLGPYLITARIVPASRRAMVFRGYSQLLSLWPGLSGDYLRRAFYRRTLAYCAPECSIGFGTTFATPLAEVGEGVYIGIHCHIGHARIRRDVLLGSHVTLLSGKHQHGLDRLDVPIRHQAGRFESIEVGPDVWIGNGALVMADVKPQAVVAAGAVVTRTVEPRQIVGGNPARVIAERGAATPPDDAARDGAPTAGTLPAGEDVESAPPAPLEPR